MLYLVEHFYSIQGEGKYLGRPSIFFRFGGCNMKCEGFGCSEIAENGVKVLGCDTVYAVNKENFSHNWIAITHESELVSILENYDLPSNVDVVFTGGEPLIYADDEIFIKFLEYLHAHNHRITFETNGSLGVDFEKHSIYRECIFALSVKLSNSGEPFNKRVRGKILYDFATHARDAFFKFSIDKEFIDIALDEEIEEICAHAPYLEVFCMPVAGNKEELESNTLPLIEYCKSKGFSYSDRLHIRIWNQNKGV